MYVLATRNVLEKANKSLTDGGNAGPAPKISSNSNHRRIPVCTFRQVLGALPTSAAVRAFQAHSTRSSTVVYCAASLSMARRGPSCAALSPTTVWLSCTRTDSATLHFGCATRSSTLSLSTDTSSHIFLKERDTNRAQPILQKPTSHAFHYARAELCE